MWWVFLRPGGSLWEFLRRRADHCVFFMNTYMSGAGSQAGARNGTSPPASPEQRCERKPEGRFEVQVVYIYICIQRTNF